MAPIQIVFSCSSVFSLAVISLERVYAVVWPLHHRTVGSRVYFSSIRFIWEAGIGAEALNILSVVEVFSLTYAYVQINGTILSSLCVVCASCVIIRTRIRRALIVISIRIKKIIDYQKGKFRVPAPSVTAFHFIRQPVIYTKKIEFLQYFSLSLSTFVCTQHFNFPVLQVLFT